jgi:hypothetical protein
MRSGAILSKALLVQRLHGRSRRASEPAHSTHRFSLWSSGVGPEIQSWAKGFVQGLEELGWVKGGGATGPAPDKV